MDVLDAFIPIAFVAGVFGIFYLYYSTRHRERMALIDKGLDASLLHPDSRSLSQIRRMVILNIALTLIGIGLGITFGILLFELTGKDAVYPASIFVMAGLGLFASTMMNKKA